MYHELLRGYLFLKRIIIWGCGLGYNKYINAIKYQELLGNIEVIGITAKDELYACIDGYPFIPIKDIDVTKVDYIIVTSEEYFEQICEMAMQVLSIEKERIVKGRVFLYPMFDFKEYIELRKSNVSIIANNCWGGLAYHQLGMEFSSPFINMFVKDEEYLKLLNNLRGYLNEKLKFHKFAYENVLQREYPVCLLNDIELHFNHYVSMEEVEEKWNKRVKRINWDNVFIMMFTEDESVAARFAQIPYEDKICFVPFESKYESVYSLSLAEKLMPRKPFYKLVNGIIEGTFSDYNLIELLNKGKIDKNRYYIN